MSRTGTTGIVPFGSFCDFTHFGKFKTPVCEQLVAASVCVIPCKPCKTRYLPMEERSIHGPVVM